MTEPLEKLLKSPNLLVRAMPALPSPPPLGPDLSEAAVLMLVDSGRLWFLKRSALMRRHPGQIAFPGGRRETHDLDLWSAALRETHEELGAEPALITFLGALPWLVTPSGYRVHPFVGWWSGAPLQPVLNEESEYAFSVPVGDLCNCASAGDRPVFPTSRGDIWGATALMLDSWLRLVRRL